MGRYWVGGATGFLGSHLVRQLVSAGHEVIAVSRSGGRIDQLEVAAVDILDEDAVRKSAAGPDGKGCDGAFLCTGKVSRDKDDAAALHELHVVGTRRALAALRAAGVKRVVYASTSGTIAVGRDPDSLFSERDHAPLDIIARWPYYRTKLYAEREALEAISDDFEVVIVNPTLLLGPGDERNSSTGDVKRFLERRVPAVPGGGMSFVDVRDVASAMIVAFDKGQSGERYLLCAKNLTIAAFFQRLERLTGIPGPKLRLPKTRALAIGANKLFSRAIEAVGGTPPVDEISVEMAQYFWYCDSSKAERELGFKPRDPGETLRDTVSDLVERRVAFPDGAVVLSRPPASA
ncbi:MAG: NAD-dependent epimerase/dehydratase family protein [Myxococcales bacterium]|nr:NAD-dependent epimerase/dehydratase family protein [Myxococcales bacterium]